MQHAETAPAASGKGFVVMPLATDQDVVWIRKVAREYLVALGCNTLDQTKMVTAASELARNTLRYGGGGEFRISNVVSGVRRGVSMSFHDKGPGIPDLDLALTDGYTTGGGMGLGLSGARRLSDDFEIETAPGAGTTVKIVKWKTF